MRTRRLVIYVITFSLIIANSSRELFASNETEELKKQIEALKQRVEELESAQKQPQPANPNYPSPYQRNWGWDPFAEMERIQEQMNQMMGDSFHRSGPNVNRFSSSLFGDQGSELTETDKGYTINFDLSGLDKDKVDIDVNKHSITIKSEYSKVEEEESENQFFHSQRFGSFIKTIPLPMDADVDQMQTNQEGDQLVITIPKK